MGGGAPERDDFDEALDSLEAELDDVSDDVSEVDDEQPAPAAPPKLPARRPNETRRIAFDELFASDSTPTSAVRGSPEEKIEYFRTKLKQAEAVIARVRDAWAVREGEMDEFEAVAARDRQRAEEAVQQRAALEQFFENKKKEFTEYIDKVTKAFADKDATEKSLREQIEQLRAESKTRAEELQQGHETLNADLEEMRAELEFTAAREDDARQELADTKEALEHDLAVREEAIAKLKQMVEDQRASVAERDAKLEEQLDAAAEQDKIAAAVRAEKEKLERALRSKAAEAKDEHQAISEMREALESDIAARDGAIARLKEGIIEAQKGLRDRDGTIEELRTELSLLTEQVSKAEADKATLERQLNAEIETLKLSVEAEREAAENSGELAARDEALQRLKEMVEEQQRAVAERELQIETLETQVAEAKREALRAQEQAMQQEVPVAPMDAAKTARLQKALHLADRLFLDLEAGHPTLFDTREGTGELLGRLRKAVSLARKAAEMI